MPTREDDASSSRGWCEPAAGRRAAGGASRARLARAALSLALGAFPAFVALAAEPDTSLSHPSDDGLFVVSIADRPDPVPLNELHAWTVHVESADGTPVNDAVIGIGGGMPMHDHGLPTAPRVTAAPGDGDYLLEGMKFQMPGHWTVRLEIEAGGASDTVTFELTL